MADRTARALVLEGPRHLAVRDLPVPRTGDDDALLRSLEVPLEDGVASWPPDGTPPSSPGVA